MTTTAILAREVPADDRDAVAASSVIRHHRCRREASAASGI